MFVRVTKLDIREHVIILGARIDVINIVNRLAGDPRVVELVMEY